MAVATQLYTSQTILASLGYANPMRAAHEHAYMMLLGRLARYQLMVQQLAAPWGCSLEELRQRYELQGTEDFAADDDYIEWQWYDEAIKVVQAQLAVILKELNDVTPVH